MENARRWRTWTIVKVKPGRYRVEVLSPAGELLAEQSFEVAEASRAPLDDLTKIDGAAGL